ncbi:hypothetical protein [Kitasatospora cinereorecta]|uniref:Uncharacterized protein n=1 Tax=Kitasatospora cinereorecta TaxID=285560 RepID=A0ABW0VPW5_9ACTN
MTQPTHVGLAPRIIPGIAAFAMEEGARELESNSAWGQGQCWLYCGRNVEVRWLGPVTVAAANAPMYACARCITRLTDLAESIVEAAPDSPRLPAPVGHGGAGVRSLIEVDLPWAITDFTREGRPHLPVPGDGTQWVIGWCWLYCGRDQLLVLPIGAVTTATLTTTLHACGRCIAHLNNLVWEFVVWLDTEAAPGNPAFLLPRAADLAKNGGPATGSAGPGRAAQPSTGGRHRRERTRTALLGASLGRGLGRLRRRSRT